MYAKPLKIIKREKVQIRSLCSVVICAYNKEQFVGEAIEGVLNQTYRPIELVLIDDASTDRTAEIIKSYRKFAREKDVFFRFIRLPNNLGAAGACSCGLAEAKGKYIGITASDDIWLPTNVEKQIALFERDDQLGLTYTDIQRIDVNGKRILNPSRFAENNLGPERGYVFQKLLLKGMFIPAISVMIKASILRKAGFLDSRYVYTNDYDFYIRIAAIAKIDYVHEVLARWRIHGDNLHLKANKTVLYQERIACVLENYNRFKAQYNIPRWKVSIVVSNNYAQAGVNEYMKGNRTKARRFFLQGMHAFPYNPINYLFWLNSFLHIRALWNIQRLKRLYVKLFFPKKKI